MTKPSETLRHARQWARRWKTAAQKLYQIARTLQTQAAAWQMTAMMQEQFAKREGQWHVEELQIQRRAATLSAPCDTCGYELPTYRSGADRKLHLRPHAKYADGVYGRCRGSFKLPKQPFDDVPGNVRIFADGSSTVTRS